MPSMRPRRLFRSPMIVPMYSSGTTTSTDITGSSSTGLALRAASLKAIEAGDLEGHFVRIHIVIAAVVERGLHVHHFVAGENAAFHGFLDALVHRLDEFLGNHAADYFVDELVALAGLVRFEADACTWPYWPLPPVCRMYLPSALRLLADGLAISHLRLADVGLHAELAHHAVHQDFQVQLAHAADDRLAAVRIGAARWNVGSSCASLPSATPIFSWSLLVFGSTATAMTGVGELDRLQHDRDALHRRCVSPVVMFFSPTQAQMSPARTSVMLLALVGVHLQQAADALVRVAVPRL